MILKNVNVSIQNSIRCLELIFLSKVFGSGSLVSRILPGRYFEPLASLNQNYRFVPGTVSKQKYCPSGEKRPNEAAAFSFAGRVGF